VSENDLRAIAANTRDIYERNAARFDVERVKVLIERGWLKRFCALLPAGAHILDAGCGAGDPIAGYFLDHGYRVTGIDFAAPMLELARARHPSARWLWGDMRELALGETFDGIIAWHSFFHLTPEEQVQTLDKFAAHLTPNGVLMVTVGPEAGEVTGRVGDEVVYHVSLAPQHYQRVLAATGMAVLAFAISEEHCDGATVLLAQKQDNAA